MMPGSKGQKAVHACMIRLLNLGPAKHEEVVICTANQRIPNVCRIAGAACCRAIRRHQVGAKDLLTPTSYYGCIRNLIKPRLDGLYIQCYNVVTYLEVFLTTSVDNPHMKI